MKSNKIIPIVVIALILGLVGWKYWEYKNPDKVKEPTALILDKGTENTTTTTVTPTSSFKNVQTVELPERPVNGTLKGVVEVGASGFNSFVVNVDKSKNWEIVSKDFGESLAYEGLATTEDIKSGLKKYISDIFNKGVSGRNVHFVMSSGALKNPKTQQIASEIQKMGYVVHKVTPEQEGKYGLRAALPPAYRENSFVVDMGSGNTKISWYEGSALKSLESYGAKYYQNNTTDEVAYNDLKTKISQIPEGKRTRCFLIGGIPYEMAKEIRSGDERFTLLKAPDDYSAGDNVKKRSGLNLYRAIVDGTGTNTYVFDWDANFTIGYLLAMN